MRLPAVACLAWLLILAQGLDVAAQDATKKADAKKADAKKDDVKKADVKKAGEADSKKESGAEAKTQPPGTESASEDTSRGWFSNMIHSGATGLLIDGGWFMVPILLMGIVAAGVIIERYRSLKMLRSDTGDVRQQVLALLRENRVEEALNYCNDQQGPVPAVLSAGIRKYLMLQQLGHDPARIEEQVVKAMDDYGVHIVAALERHLPVLGTVSSAAPMLGFLGTVAGMITSFNDIVEQMGETNIVESASQGISQALLTTCFGLMVGIPAFMAFNYFTSVINSYVLDVEESATELIETVTQEMALNQQA
ncbi:MAG: MotA/TolQ/ExbB proton channel family protein [Planctomycetota bacterium]|nr:MotA/TolQ/ExbB proton channel family protein [Planctomycetota bacterium]